MQSPPYANEKVADGRGAHIHFLHISDLQCGSKHCWWAPRTSPASPPVYAGRFHRLLVEALCEILKKGATSALRDEMREGFKVHGIVMTGDIAEKGTSEEYGAAARFIDALQSALRERFRHSPAVLVVPGNHDVNWAETQARTPGTKEEEEFVAKFAAFHAFARRVMKDDVHKKHCRQLNGSRPAA